ncbi:hypothetical protein QAD02_006777 [Eretmocerus hayati]|uniref:Uncharacterized protein n=1 Tax=Eretmocerus hayati TaxID=131215 RepID=A0ACC2N639_9HYME|nr:hypothetical protein QAD02_006777 [Eretmocerus hayati]
MRGRFCSGNLEACTKIVKTEDKAEKQQDSSLPISSPTRTIGDEVMSGKMQENSTSQDTGVMEGHVAEEQPESRLIKKTKPFLGSIILNLTLSPGQNALKYSSRVDTHHYRRKNKATAHAFKLSRILLKKAKKALRHENEAVERTTYESDVGLLTTLHETIPVRKIRENLETVIVYFDLETGGLSKSADILQIAAKYKDYTFQVSVRPYRKISPEASQVHGLVFVNN